MNSTDKKNTPNAWWIALGIFVVMSLTVFFIVKNLEKTKQETEQAEWSFPAIKVIVLNGCGFSGVAGNVRTNLSDKNVDVISVSNARKFIYDETLIIVKHNDPEDLQRLMAMTKINNVIYAVNETYSVPFIIVAGRDYQKYFNG